DISGDGKTDHAGSLIYGVSAHEQVFWIENVSDQVQVEIDFLLGGTFDSVSGTMRDDLRDQHLLPYNDPYMGQQPDPQFIPQPMIDPDLMSVTGENAIVDWCMIELRSDADPTNSVIDRSCLLLKNGSVVDIHGSTEITIDVPPGNYHIAIRHRNHLGV